MPKLTERLRERVEEEVDKIMDRLLAALKAEQGFVFGTRLDVFLASLPDYSMRLCGVRENFDRLEGLKERLGVHTGKVDPRHEAQLDDAIERRKPTPDRATR